MPRVSNSEMLIFLSVFVYVGMFSFGTQHNIGFRFMLPMLPLLHIYSSRIFSLKINQKVKICIVNFVVAGYILSSLSIYPHYLSFFNILAGGPKNGHNYLIDSNIDWGQDLVLLKEYMDKKGIETVNLAYFGRVDPSIYGIDYELLDRERKKGIAALSVNYYQGLSYDLLKERKIYPVQEGYYKYFHEYPIKDRIGYSILIFDVDTSSKQQ